MVSQWYGPKSAEGGGRIFPGGGEDTGRSSHGCMSSSDEVLEDGGTMEDFSSSAERAVSSWKSRRTCPTVTLWPVGRSNPRHAHAHYTEWLGRLVDFVVLSR
eukprot:640261_1